MPNSSAIINHYSKRWFNLFLKTQQYTTQEVAFVQQQLPNPPFSRVMDLCCGPARHSRWLAQAGYQITGVDLDWVALTEAQQVTGSAADFIQLDMRQLSALSGHFDAVICLWQSFGYFDVNTNTAILKDVSRLLRPMGRFILDIYHKGFFKTHQGSQQLNRQGQNITIINTLEGDRLTAELNYGDGREVFDWQLFTPEEMVTLAQEAGLSCLLACTLFDQAQPVTADQPRTQLVFERTHD